MNDTHAAPLTVAFLDFEGVLFDRDGSAWRARDVLPLLSRLGKDNRLGLLCNLPRRYDAASFRLLLRDHGFEAWFDPELIVLASALPTPLPDRRAFAVAAALAEAKPETLTYITANPKLSAAAEESGWHTAPLIRARGSSLAECGHGSRGASGGARSRYSGRRHRPHLHSARSHRDARRLQPSALGRQTGHPQRKDCRRARSRAGRPDRIRHNDRDRYRRDPLSGP